jgi:hypothetical protein
MEWLTVFINSTGATYSSANQPTNNTVTEHLRLLNNDFTSVVTDHYLLMNSVDRIEDTRTIKNYFIAYESENKESLNA